MTWLAWGGPQLLSSLRDEIEQPTITNSLRGKKIFRKLSKALPGNVSAM